MSSSNLISPPVDTYYHYDSSVSNGDKKISIKLPKQGNYYWSIDNICLEFPDDYKVDALNGYIFIAGFTNDQSGSVIALSVKPKEKGLMFPLRDPAEKYPKCTIHNLVLLEVYDTFKIKFLDKEANPVDMKRIVLTVHCTDDISYLK